MTGRVQSARRLALPALLLAVFVPARALALCCLEAPVPVSPASAHAAHGATAHHRSAGEPQPSGQDLTTASAAYCDVLTTIAPALRERGRQGDIGSGADSPALAPTPWGGESTPSARLGPRIRRPFPRPAGLETPSPLRL